MKVSELIQELERYQKIHGDDKIEFLEYNEEGCESSDLAFVKLHDGYVVSGCLSNAERICEFRLK